MTNEDTITYTDLRDSAGNLDPAKCLKFTRNALLTDIVASNGAVASDAMLEIAETIVPGLVSELTGRTEDAMDRAAEVTFDEAAKKHLGKLTKALQRLEIKAALQNITFTIPPNTGSRDDPIIITCSVPPEQWTHVPELAARLGQLKAALNNE